MPGRRTRRARALAHGAFAFAGRRRTAFGAGARTGCARSACRVAHDRARLQLPAHEQRGSLVRCRFGAVRRTLERELRRASRHRTGVGGDARNRLGRARSLPLPARSRRRASSSRSRHSTFDPRHRLRFVEGRRDRNHRAALSRQLGGGPVRALLRLARRNRSRAGRAGRWRVRQRTARAGSRATPRSGRLRDLPRACLPDWRRRAQSRSVGDCRRARWAGRTDVPRGPRLGRLAGTRKTGS